MSLTRQIAHNTIIQTVGKLISVFLGIISLGIMTRYLGPNGFGQYTIVVAFLQFFAIIADMGLMIITAQMISRPGVDEQKVLSNIFTLRLFSSIAFLSLAPIVVMFFPYPPLVKLAISIFTISFFLLSLIQVLTGLFQKKLRMIKVTTADLIGKSTIILFVVIAVKLNLGLLGIIIAGIIGNIFNFIFLFISARKITRIKLSFDFKIWKETLSRSWPIAISIAFNLIYLKTDTIILSLYHSETAVGIYGASFRFLEIMIMIPTMFMGLILPLLSNYWSAKNFSEFKKMLQMSFNVMIMSITPLVVGGIILATPIMILVAGKEFAMAAPVLRIIIIASAVVFIGTLYGHTVVALEKQRQMIWAYAMTAVISMTVYLIVIPKYSYFGAAWSTVFAESLIAIATFWMVVKTTKMWPDLTIFIKSMISSGVMAGTLYFTYDQTLLLSVPIAVTTYFFILYLTGGFSKEFIKEIVKIK